MHVPLNLQCNMAWNQSTVAIAACSEIYTVPCALRYPRLLLLEMYHCVLFNVVVPPCVLRKESWWTAWALCGTETLFWFFAVYKYTKAFGMNQVLSCDALVCNKVVTSKRNFTVSSWLRNHLYKGLRAAWVSLSFWNDSLSFTFHPRLNNAVGGSLWDDFF